MIRVAIIAIVLAAAAILFLPQTVAAFPVLGSVVGSLASDVEGVQDGALSWASDMLSDVLVGVGSSIMAELPGALEAPPA